MKIYIKIFKCNELLSINNQDLAYNKISICVIIVEVKNLRNTDIKLQANDKTKLVELGYLVESIRHELET
jgi:hypothetical protein